MIHEPMIKSKSWRRLTVVAILAVWALAVFMIHHFLTHNGGWTACCALLLGIVALSFIGAITDDGSEDCHDPGMYW